MLKLIVDFTTLLIGAEGARLHENANAFPSCGDYSRKLIQCPAGERGNWETPQAVTPRRFPSLLAESKCLERKSTDKLFSLKTTIYAKRAFKNDTTL